MSQLLPGGGGKSLREWIENRHLLLSGSVVPGPSTSLRPGLCKRSKAEAAFIVMLGRKIKLGQPPTLSSQNKAQIQVHSQGAGRDPDSSFGIPGLRLLPNEAQWNFWHAKSRK
jgi:hypothetical protein